MSHAGETGTGARAVARTDADLFDLLIVTDATSSMFEFLQSLNRSLPEIIHMTTLTGAFSRIGVLAYRDYCDDDDLLEWSGWCEIFQPDPPVEFGGHPRDQRTSQSDLLRFVRNIRHFGGGDYPEATKTALAMAHDVMREEAMTIMLLYTDAPPHLQGIASMNIHTEMAALTKDSYGGYGSRFSEWISASRTLRGEETGKKAVVHSIVEQGSAAIVQSSAYLSTITGGACLELEQQNQSSISQLTIGILLAWMGIASPGDTSNNVLASLQTFWSRQSILALTSEGQLVDKIPHRENGAVGSKKVTLRDLPRLVRPRAEPLGDFAKRYATDAGYQLFVTNQLKSIIENNIRAMTINPVFGKLWRTVCAYRSNPARDELIALFGLNIEKASDSETKAQLRVWLAESYDFSEDIAHLIDSVSEEEQFPCVYLDPMQDFTAQQLSRDGEDTRHLSEFTRDELLEIGRSCDFRVLQRLGKVLTQFTYIEKLEDLPHHIRTAGPDVVPRIPIVLVKGEYKREFWMVLLHIVLPGTKLARRPAALLAALSLRMGIQPLREVADTELIRFRDYWNTLEIPETWNVSCLNLLLDADDDYRQRVADHETQPDEPGSSLLLDKDRQIFKTLVDYKMLELNLQTTLIAKVGWTPEKSKAALGPQVTCRRCKYPRSVTIMARNGICGLCVLSTNYSDCTCEACSKSDEHQVRLHNHVSRKDDERTEATWVECVVKKCHAQYVVYNPKALNVRAKCFYCRHPSRKVVGPAPCIECTKCRNRMIYPMEYRPNTLDIYTWECVACTSNLKTIIDVETSAKALTMENGNEWLLAIKKHAIRSPLSGKSLFRTASTATLDTLAENLNILPLSSTALILAGKPLHNTTALTSSLRTWVLSRRTESGECTLCFTSAHKSSLLPACGRTGCHQLICDPCRIGWYGLNAPGQIINVAALVCPFCRRMPAPGPVSRFGITRMGNLSRAVTEVGEWVYAWCADCGSAKRYSERVCERGLPSGIQGWECEDCVAHVWDVKVDGGLMAVEVSAVRDSTMRNCPGCGVLTEKMMGCDHIECPCGTHWCYQCGEESKGQTIYRHIYLRHTN